MPGTSAGSEDEFGDLVPVDGACAGPEMLVAQAVVVVQVQLADAGLEEFECVIEAGVAEVGVAYVEVDADVVEVADVEDLEDMLRRGDFVLKVLDEDLDTERMSEGLDVLDGGERVLDSAAVPGIVFEAEVEGDGGDGDHLGGLEGALNLVHGFDALGLVGRDERQGGGDVAGPALGLLWAEDGLMQGGGGSGVPEPVGDPADDGAIGVVEVVARGEELDSAGAAVAKSIQQAGVKSLGEEDMGGDTGLHGEFKNTTAEAVEVCLSGVAGLSSVLGWGGDIEVQ